MTASKLCHWTDLLVRPDSSQRRPLGGEVSTRRKAVRFGVGLVLVAKHFVVRPALLAKWQGAIQSAMGSNDCKDQTALELHVQ